MISVEKSLHQLTPLRNSIKYLDNKKVKNETLKNRNTILSRIQDKEYIMLTQNTIMIERKIMLKCSVEYPSKKMMIDKVIIT